MIVFLQHSVNKNMVFEDHKLRRCEISEVREVETKLLGWLFSIFILMLYFSLASEKTCVEFLKILPVSASLYIVVETCEDSPI